MNFRRPALFALFNLLSLLLFNNIAAPRAQGQTKQPETVDYLSPQESEIINEINLARTRPQEYVAYLEQLRKYYSGNEIKRPGEAKETTNEGVGAVDEAINFLRAAKALPPLGVAKGMCLAARDHIKDLEQANNTGHKGSDGSITEDRLKRYGSWNSAVGENIAYSSTAARDIVIGWIIDDGTASRGHRKAIFNADFSTTGIATGKSNAYGPLCVSVFSDSFKENPATGSSSTDKPKTAARKF
ncbi:MAG: hypothetical protein QOD00_823 [Blastocatellia bacterium]|jgi:uncharacterized protein YkwD|nr:hypothetical protein [Blastocatellia bacterium]